MSQLVRVNQGKGAAVRGGNVKALREPDTFKELKGQGGQSTVQSRRSCPDARRVSEGQAGSAFTTQDVKPLDVKSNGKLWKGFNNQSRDSK